MKQAYSNADCYKILGTSPAQSFSEIRKAYKRKIQKYHPDKLEDAKKDAASDKIKQLSVAFSQIEKHYKTHNSLPSIETKDIASDNLSQTPKSDNSINTNPIKRNRTTVKSIIEPSKSTVFHHTAKNKSKPRLSLLIITIALVSFFIFFMENSYNYKKITTRIKPIETPIKDQISISTKTKKIDETRKNIDKNKKPDKKIPDFFTINSSIGEVIDVQGKPDKINKNIWIYGQSKVIFHNGFVTDWIREKGSPIKAKLIIKTDN